jgi:uncharacterized membrane protein
MNRAFFIILIPVALVAIGYILVLRSMGFAPGYGRLAVAATLLIVAIWWAGPRTARRADSGRP